MIRTAFNSVFLFGALLSSGLLGLAQEPAVTQIVGGRGGMRFADRAIPSEVRVLEINISSREMVDSVQMVYVLPDGRTLASEPHGGPGGQMNTFRLDSDEYITGISGRYGDYIDSIRIHTNKRESPLFGGRGGYQDYRINVPTGNQAVGFAGRAGDYLDAIGLTCIPIWLRPLGQTAIAGGGGGSAFSDRNIPVGARISEVRVRSGSNIDGIQVIYTFPDGSLFQGVFHGGTGGSDTTFRLDPDEYIVGISGRYGDYIDSLSIRTNKRTSPIIGGRGGFRNFDLQVPAGMQAVGFVGRAGLYLDAIGLSYTQQSREIPRRRPGGRFRNR